MKGWRHPILLRSDQAAIGQLVPRPRVLSHVFTPPRGVTNPFKRDVPPPSWSLVSGVSLLEQCLSENHPSLCNLAQSLDRHGDDGEKVVRQDLTRLLRQRIQALEAALQTQQQESRPWQKRLDLILDKVLCNQCIEDKDDAYYAEQGLHWAPSPSCPVCVNLHTSLQAPMPEQASRYKNSLPYYQDEEDSS